MSLGCATRLWALDSPTLTVDANTLMYGLDGKLTIPMPAFLIEHKRGIILYDTGISPDAIEDPAGVYGPDMAAGLGIEGTSGQAVDKQIADLGFANEDITHVISSHLHFDHSGGHHLFPNAKFYAGEGELAFAHYPDPIGAFCYMPDQLARIRTFDWREVPGVDVDLFGDGSLVMIPTPGHTPGQLSLKVRLASRTFLLTGDAVHLREALQREYHFPIDADTKSSLRTLRKLKRVAESEDATFWISHDPEDWKELQHAPYCYE